MDLKGPPVDESGLTKEPRNLTQPSPGTSYVTLAPYAPASAPTKLASTSKEAPEPEPKPKRKAKRQSSFKPASKQQIEDLFSIRNDSWTRFFVIADTGDLDNIEIYDDLKTKLPDEFECHRRNNGSILIDTKTINNSRIIEEMKHIVTEEVSTSRDAMLNSRRGTIIVPLSEFKSEDTIKERLMDHLIKNDLPIVDVTIYKKTSRRNTTLTCACITFGSRSLPDEIRIGFKKVKVKEDLPKPRQCRSCWMFGHLSAHCRGSACCPVCSDTTHPFENCQYRGNPNYKGLCSNCDKQGHTALSQKCEFYLKEQETLILMYSHGIPKYEAKKLLEESGRFRRGPFARRTQPNKQTSNATQRQQAQNQALSSPEHHSRADKADANQNLGSRTTATDAQKPNQTVDSNTLAPPQVANLATMEPPLSNTPPEIETNVEGKLREMLGDPVDGAILSMEEEPFLSFSTDTDPADPSGDPIPSQTLPGTTQNPQKSENADPAEDPIPSQVFTRKELPQPQRTSKRGRENNPSPTSINENKPKRTTSDNASQPNQPTSHSSPKKSNLNQRPQDKDLPDSLSPLSRVISFDKPRGAKLKKEPKDGQHKGKHDCGCHSCIKELAIIKNEVLDSGEQISSEFLKLVKERKVYFPTKLAFHPTECMCRQHLLQRHMAKPTNKGKGHLVSNIRKSFENLRKKDNKPTSEPEKEPDTPTEDPINKQSISVITSR